MPRTTTVAVTFSRNIDPATAGQLAVFSAQAGGRLSGTYATSGGAVSVAPATDLKPGETVAVSIPVTLRAASGGANLTPQVYQFTAATGGPGRGRFQGGGEVALGSGPSEVIVADVDGDGDLDLVAASNDASSLTVRLNEGTGSFSGTLVLPLARAPLGLAVGDVDGDGDLDLLTPNFSANTVSIRRNNGTGVFTGTTEVAVGGGPTRVTVGDVDADGDLDILTASSAARTVSVRLNNGAGSFAGPREVATEADSYGVTAADMDGDGDLDLLTTNLGPRSVSVRLNEALLPLPVTFTSFRAEAARAATVRLTWTTATESNSAYFQVERSRDGRAFTATGPRVAAAGSSGRPRSYSFTDGPVPAGERVLYYRLQQVDADGTVAYSVVRPVALPEASGRLTLLPNPTSSVPATLRGAQPGAAVRIFDGVGRLVLTTTADAAGTAPLTLPTGLPRGVYLVRTGRHALRWLRE